MSLSAPLWYPHWSYLRYPVWKQHSYKARDEYVSGHHQTQIKLQMIPIHHTISTFSIFYLYRIAVLCSLILSCFTNFHKNPLPFRPNLALRQGIQKIVGALVRYPMLRKTCIANKGYSTCHLHKISVNVICMYPLAVLRNSGQRLFFYQSLQGRLFAFDRALMLRRKLLYKPLFSVHIPTMGLRNTRIPQLLL